MKAGIFGPSSEFYSRNWNAERSINLYPVISDSQGAKEPMALFGTPGLEYLGTAGGGPIRGAITCGNGRSFCLSGSELYEINSDNTVTLRGTVSTFSNPVSMDENGTQLMLATSPDGYIFNFDTNAFTQITDVDFPGADYVTYLDGYFIVTPPNNLGKFYISALFDGLVWDALDFATAESSPDGLQCPYSYNGQLLLFGDYTTEIWYNSGNVDFPFSRISGGRMELGTPSKFSVQRIDDSVFFIGRDKQGTGTVFRINGAQPKRISTQFVEQMVSMAADTIGSLSQIVGFGYQKNGHLFYILNGSGMDTAVAYDCATTLWHERASLNQETGFLQRWIATFHIYAFNKNIVFDRESGNFYNMDDYWYDENGYNIKRVRVFTHIYSEGQRFPISDLGVDFEGGVGLVGGDSPIVCLRMSRDFGHTWSSEYQATIGKIGEYKQRAMWRRLGVQQEMTFEVSTSEKVKIAITGGYFNVGKR
jgi:hypothetical protein